MCVAAEVSKEERPGPWHRAARLSRHLLDRLHRWSMTTRRTADKKRREGQMGPGSAIAVAFVATGVYRAPSEPSS